MTNRRIVLLGLGAAMLTAFVVVVLTRPTEAIDEFHATVPDIGTQKATSAAGASLRPGSAATDPVLAPSADYGRVPRPPVVISDLYPSVPKVVSSMDAVPDANIEATQWLREGEGGVDRWRYTERDFLDLRGKDLSGADLQYVDMSNADLRTANLRGTDLQNADLRGANLQDAILEGTFLYGADLREAVLRDTTAGPVNASNADLRGADLRGTRLACTDCSVWSTAMSSNFSHADMRDFDFGSSRVDGSVFDGTDLRGANLAGTRGVPLSLSGALYDERTQFPAGFNPLAWKMILHRAE